MELSTVPGSLLAASPDMLDPNFMHTVVLMCLHGEQGAHGLVINRPAPITIDKLLPEHPLLARQRFPVHAGGPVGLDTLQFVHRVPERIPGGVELGDGVYLGGELDAMANFLDSAGDEARRHLRLILGHAGWGEGQLEGELAGSAWLPVAAKAEWIFSDEPGAVWRRVVRSLGRETSGLEDLPPDVSWN